MAAELRLGVSFDLAYFRTQLDKLARIAASEFTAPIKIKLDRQVVDRELNNLQRSIKRRKYNIELNIAGNLSKKSFDELQERLDTLGERQKIEVPVSVKNAATGKDISEAIAALRARIAQNQSVKQGGGKLRIGVSIQASISNDDIANFRKAVKEKFAGITNKADVSIGVKNAASGKDIADTVAAIRSRINQNQSIKQGDGKLRVGLSIKPAITNADIAGFKRAVEEKFSGLSVKIKADVQAGAAPSTQSLNAPGSTRRPSFLDSPAYKAERESLARSTAASLSKAARELPEGRNRQEIERLLSELSAKNLQGKQRSAALDPIRDLLARARYQQGLGIEARLQPIRGQQGISAPRSMPNLNQMLDRIANLTENPRAAQRMLRMMPENRLTTDLIGAANRQAAFKETGPGKFLDLKGKPFDPLLKSIAESFSDYTRSVNSSNPWVGKIGNGLGKFIERALTLSPEQMFGGRAPIPSSRLLPAAGRSSASRMMRSAFSGLPAIEAPQIGGEGAPLSRAASYMLNKARQVLGLSVGPTSAYTGNPFAGAATVPQRSFFRFGQGAQLPGLPIQAALPPAGTTTNYGGGGFFGYGGVRGVGGGDGGGGGGRGGALAITRGPASDLPAGYFERTKINQALAGADKYLSKAKFPLSGAIKELGSEFATATKQVLLFGTAYKALAFFTSLPGQAFEAAKSLQTFENQLEAVTGGAAQADRSFAFIDNLANRFNVPLQSARDGFVKLYASMAPAGFNSGEIENLFEGISKATATFGLSADQVDRVNNAFSQMASKGQIMSEELKGQLGDVLPGSLALFARAAQMSIPEFSKAMEDGAFKGEAMAQVLRNVAKIMNSDFGGAAANAANTLQGALNGMQNAVKRMYEAFEPVVAIIAGQIFPVFSGVIDDATQAIKAFGMQMEGINPATNLMSENAQSLYKNIELAVDTFNTLSVAVQALVPTFQVFGNILGGALQLFNAIVGNPVGEFFVKLAVNVGIATAAISALSSAALANAIRQLLLFIGNIKLTITALRTLITTSRAAKIAVGGIVAGVVMVGLEMLVTRITAAKEETEKLRNAALGAADALKQMTYQQLVGQEKNVQRLIRNLETLQAASKGNLNLMRPSAQQIQMAQELGLPVTGRAGQQSISLVRAEGMRQQLLEQLPQIRGEMKSRFAGPTSTSLDLEEVDLAAGKGKGKRKSLSELVSRQILMLAEAEKAMIKLALAETKGMAPDTVQADRMLDFYAKFRDNLVDIQAIEAQIAAAEQNRDKWIKEYGLTGEEIDSNLVELRNQLKIATIDLATTEQEYRNRAKKDAAKEAAELEKKLEKQKELNRLLEDAAIEAGVIGPLEAARIQQRRGFESALDQARKDGTPEQVARLEQLQAVTPVVGSLAEAYKKAKDELELLTDGTRMITTAAQGFGDAFSKAFTDIITGAQSWKEGLGNAFKSVASMFADMVTQMLAKWAVLQIMQMFLPGAGTFAGGTKLGGSVAMPSSVGIGAGGGIIQNAGGQGFGTFGPNFGIRQFATGGLVTGPTLGLVGEGRFNEAVVPLPNGKSIPVDLGNGAGSNISTNIVVNVNNGQASSQMNGNGGQSLGRELEGAVRSVILKESRPGGIIYNQR